ncbi:MAG: hypothetical protein JRH15_18275 [Deltaproteobacteria bacterium]|nr:hypothetical protein [Deltaproteobacteria bacterium]
MANRKTSKLEWLKHAFAIDSAGAVKPTESQLLVVEKVCREIVKRRLTTPALMFLEMYRPFSYVGSQVMLFFHPIVATFLKADGYRHFTEFLENRGSVDTIANRIEELEKHQSEKEKNK